jgi:hypothetical protein
LCFENTYISGSDVNKGKRLTATVAELEALYREDVTNGINPFTNTYKKVKKGM